MIEHSLEFIPCDPQALTKYLDTKVAEGFEFLQVMLLPIAQPQMQGGRLVQQAPQPAFGVLMQRTKLDEGQEFLDVRVPLDG